MGQPIQWQYALVWTSEASKPEFTLWRISNQGHRFSWAAVPAKPMRGIPTVDQVLEELYAGLLVLMETTC